MTRILFVTLTDKVSKEIMLKFKSPENSKWTSLNYLNPYSNFLRNAQTNAVKL